MAIKAKDQVTIVDFTDIKAVTVYYLLQLSTLATPIKPTVASPSGWTTTEPTFDNTSTKTLYTCVKNIFGDDSFSWGDVSVSSSYEAAKQAYAKATNAQNTADNNYNKIISQGQNLVVNGTGLLGNNTNFSQWTFTKSEAYGSTGSFTYPYASGSPTMCTDEYFPVNPDKNYLFSLYAKSTTTSYWYAFVNMYDVDKNTILGTHVNFISGSTTTLSQDLKNGDTVVYLSSLNGWNTTTTATYQKGFIFWNYKNSGGYQYPVETYSRNVFQNKYTDGTSVNKTSNTITLSSAWTGGTFSAGTSVSQCSGDAVSIYGPLIYTSIPTSWGNYKCVFGPNGYNFRSGTAFCKLGFLWNYSQATSGTGYIANITFGEYYASQIDLNTTNNNLATNYSTTSSMNSAINQSKTNILSTVSSTYATQASLNSVDSKFSNYSTTSQMNSAIDQRANAITSTVSSTYATKTEVNNVQIGGRNLFKNSTSYSTWSAGGCTKTIGQQDPYGGNNAVLVGSHSTTNSYLLISGEVCKQTGPHSLSVWLKGSKAGSVWVSFNNPNGRNIDCSKLCDVTTDWQRYEFTGNVTQLSSTYGFALGGWSSWTDLSLDVYMAFPMLSFGNKTMDWTPAPEDVDLNISNTATNTLNNAKAYTDSSIVTAKSEIKQTTDSITQTVSSVSSVANTANSTANSALSNAATAQSTANSATGTANTALSTVNSKSKTFVSTPTPPYSAGDIWNNSNSVYICTTARASGSYTASDWTKAGDVTANNTAANASSLGGTSASTITNNINTAQSTATSANNLATTANNTANTATTNINSLTTRMSSAESKLTATALTTTISSALNGSNSISTTQFVMDSTGLLIKNGGFKIQNNAGTTVFSTDTSGNVDITGKFQTTTTSQSGISNTIHMENSEITLTTGTTEFKISPNEIDWASGVTTLESTGPIHLGGSDVTIDTMPVTQSVATGPMITLSGSDIYINTSIGSLNGTDIIYLNGSTVNINGIVNVINKPMSVGGNLTVNGTSTLNGAITTSSNITATGTITGTGNVKSNANLVGNGLQITGNASVTGGKITYGTTPIPKFFYGTTVVNFGGGNSVILFSNSGLNSTFGVSNVGNLNTVAFICNGDGGASPAHTTGVTYIASDGNWYATIDRNVAGSMRINYLVVYFG